MFFKIIGWNKSVGNEVWWNDDGTGWKVSGWRTILRIACLDQVPWQSVWWLLRHFTENHTRQLHGCAVNSEDYFYFNFIFSHFCISPSGGTVTEPCWRNFKLKNVSLSLSNQLYWDGPAEALEFLVHQFFNHFSPTCSASPFFSFGLCNQSNHLFVASYLA